MTNKEEIIRYCEECISGAIPSGKKHVWACKRFLRDLERVGTPDFPYIWDEQRADRIVKWFSLLKHSKGALAGTPIELTAWQKFRECQIYVWIQTTYVKKGRYGGDIVVKGFWPMQSECVDVLMDDAGIFGSKGQLYYHYTDPKTGQDYVYRHDSVLHFKTWLTWDGIMGKSVQDILKTTVGSAGYSQSYLNELYKSGMTASSTLQYTGELDDKLRAKLQKKYNDLLTGVKNAGKVVAIPVGFTLQPLTYKLTDAQYYEMRKYTALQIAAAFGVKPNQINDYEKSSYANSETQQLAFLVDTMLFRLTMYEQEINYKCLTHKERSEGFLFKFNEKVLLRANAESQMQVITSAIQNGVYTPNEGRHYLDLPSKEGGDILIVNGNYVPLTSVGAAYGVNGKGGKE